MARDRIVRGWRYAHIYTRPADEHNPVDWGGQLGPLSVWASFCFGFGLSVHIEPLVWGVPTVWVQLTLPAFHVRLTLIPGLYDLFHRDDDDDDADDDDDDDDREELR